jgi:hypothetical protein
MDTDRFVEKLFSSFPQWFAQVSSYEQAPVETAPAADAHTLGLAFDHE